MAAAVLAEAAVEAAAAAVVIPNKLEPKTNKTIDHDERHTATKQRLQQQQEWKQQQPINKNSISFAHRTNTAKHVASCHFQAA